MNKLKSEVIRKKIKAFNGLTEEERDCLLSYLDKRESSKGENCTDSE